MTNVDIILAYTSATQPAHSDTRNSTEMKQIENAADKGAHNTLAQPKMYCGNSVSVEIISPLIPNDRIILSLLLARFPDWHPAFAAHPAVAWRPFTRKSHAAKGKSENASN